MKWEYCFVDLEGGRVKLQPTLEKLGREGWGYVGPTPGYMWTLIFMRAQREPAEESPDVAAAGQAATFQQCQQTQPPESATVEVSRELLRDCARICEYGNPNRSTWSGDLVRAGRLLNAAANQQAQPPVFDQAKAITLLRDAAAMFNTGPIREICGHMAVEIRRFLADAEREAWRRGA